MVSNPDYLARRSEMAMSRSGELVRRATQLVSDAKKVAIRNPFYDIDPVFPDSVHESLLSFVETAITPDAGKSHVLFVIGEQGGGKTQNVERIALHMNDKHTDTQDFYTVITAERALSIVAPQRMSGQYTSADYFVSSVLMTNALAVAISDYKFPVIMVEAPTITGIYRNGKVTGEDRGTTTIWNLAHRVGSFNDLSYDMFVLALVNSPVRKKAVVKERRENKRELKVVYKRPGGSAEGMQRADEDIALCMEDLLGVDRNYLRDPEVRSRVLMYGFFPQFLGHSYLHLPQDRVFLGVNNENTHQMNKGTSAMRYHDFISQMEQENRISDILPPGVSYLQAS